MGVTSYFPASVIGHLAQHVNTNGDFKLHVIYFDYGYALRALMGVSNQLKCVLVVKS